MVLTKSKLVPAIFLLLLSLMQVDSVYAAADISSMRLMAADMQGTTSFYYSNEWLVKFVQFVISWLCIIALLVYYAGWLCSMVVLSNKELFYLIDTIKKEAQEGGDAEKNRFGIGAVLHTFKTGSKDGVNGGLDNVLLFILSLSINFKAYSYYKDVEAGSDDGASGSKFNYNDTMLNFILKTLIPAVTITFITSVAISGVLLQAWFTIGDVFIVRAERFAQYNLSAKIDEWLGDDSHYTFTFSQLDSAGAQLANSIATTMYANMRGQYTGLTPDQQQAVGKAIEKKVFTDILGGDTHNYYKQLESKVKESVGAANQASIVIENEDQARLVSVSALRPNTNEKSSATGAYSVSMKDILKDAQISPDSVNKSYGEDLYMHFVFKWDTKAAESYYKTNSEKKGIDGIPVITEGSKN